MSRYSKEDIIRMVREDDVEFIRMQFTDIFGQLKNVAITSSAPCWISLPTPTGFSSRRKSG